MVYVALLRGINVGGNSKVEMKRLKVLFEELGFESVSTYINSGNVIFVDKDRSAVGLVQIIEPAIEKEFGFPVKVVVRDLKSMRNLMGQLPDEWTNDDAMKTDVMFLWEDVDNEKVLGQVVIKPEMDNVIYAQGAILWSVDRKLVTRSGMLRLAGTPLYKQMTIRNCNTARKLLALMEVADKPL